MSENNKSSSSILRESLLDVRKGYAEDLLPFFQNEIESYNEFSGEKIPEDLDKRIQESIRDMKIIISRIDYLINKVFDKAFDIANNEERLNRCTEYFIFREDINQKDKAFDDILRDMVAFNKSIEEDKNQEEEGDERIS